MFRHRLQLGIAVASATLALLSPTSLLAQQAPAASSAPAATPSADRLPYKGGPVPAGYHVDSSPSYGLIGLGGAITGIGVVTFLAASSQSDRTCAHQEESCTSANLSDIGALALGGGVMVAGIITMVVGMAAPNKYLVKTPDTSTSAPTRQRQRDRDRVMLQVAPQCGPHQLGVGMVGVF